MGGGGRQPIVSYSGLVHTLHGAGQNFELLPLGNYWGRKVAIWNAGSQQSEVNLCKIAGPYLENSASYRAFGARRFFKQLSADFNLKIRAKHQSRLSRKTEKESNISFCLKKTHKWISFHLVQKLCP